MNQSSYFYKIILKQLFNCDIASFFLKITKKSITLIYAF